MIYVFVFAVGFFGGIVSTGLVLYLMILWDTDE